jgi:hypothetical protein
VRQLHRANTSVQNNNEAETGLRIQNVEAEQIKYNNFWIGIQKRVAIQKGEFREDVLHNLKERLQTKVITLILFTFLFV